MTKTAVAKAKPQAVPAQSGDGATILTMMERVLHNPDVPVEKLERIFDLYQRSQADQAKRAYQAALADMQIELPIIEKRGEGHNSKYAKWEDIVDKINPVISKHGFALSFRTETLDGTLKVTCVLSHRDGHSDETTLALPFDVSGKKNPIQSVGSSASYGKRYAACALLNIVARDEDDDANSTSENNDPITKAQIEELIKLIEETKTDINKFLEFGNIDCLDDLNSKGFQTAKAFLLKKKKEQAK